MLNVRAAIWFVFAATCCSQTTWDQDHLGNHRAVLRVSASADAVRVHIPWRRRDRAPEQENLIVVDGKTGNEVTNVARLEINREFGEIAFQPVSGAGTYYVYYLPYVMSGRPNYPKVTYPEPKPQASAGWLARLKNGPLPEAAFVAMESIDEFDRFSPMEVIATRQEADALLAKHPQEKYFVFPEDRSLAIRMAHDLPQSWIERGPGQPFRGSAAKGEFYTFQLGVWAARGRLANVRVSFSAPGFRCFNQGGIDWQSRAFTHVVNVEKGNIQPFWCGVEASHEMATTLTVTADGEAPTQIPFRLAITKEVIRNSGDDDPARLSRLRWLDSKLAVDDGIVAPYTPVRVQGRRLGVLGRQVTLNEQGYPASISSYFDIEMTHMASKPREVLAAPISLLVKDEKGQPLHWTGSGVHFTKRAEGIAAWSSQSHAGAIDSDMQASLEFDGNMEFSIALSAHESVSVSDVVLEIPLRADVARLAMGLGLKGGKAPDRFDWKWDVTRNQDGAWVGDVNAGLQFSLHDDHYSRPLNTNFYQSKPLVMPASWANNGKGGCSFLRRDNRYLIQCFSGPQAFRAGEARHYYDLRLLLTPFHTIDTAAQWKTRYYHAYKPLDEIAAAGANTINVHHATEINPYINYPFLRPNEMKAYIDQAHARGMKVKIYYTVRELTDHAPELVPLLSLGDEVIARGPGGGPAWLQEHLNGDYIEGWYVPELRDAALITTGISRWHNFYVEGLRWLVRNVGIDGLYLDDVAFDRTTMKRVRKVLVREHPGAMIDLHSANQFNPRDGFANSANLYLEHFPFIDRLWFGEYFDYNSPPDYWLTEISGIPFGLMGEMLQDKGNLWRGMLFGMTNRLPWSGDPRPLWKFWDASGIAKTRMLGWWLPSNPVKTGREDVLATVYQAPGHSIVALASWAKEPVDVKLEVDWRALGLDPAHTRIRAEAIENFQTASVFAAGQAITVQPGRGWLLIFDQH